MSLFYVEIDGKTVIIYRFYFDEGKFIDINT